MRLMSTLILVLPLSLIPMLASASAGSKPLVQLTRVEVNGQSSSAVLTVRQGPVDLVDLSLTDLDGDPTILSSASRLLETGSEVLIVWPKVPDPPAGAVPMAGHVLASTDDQLMLLFRETPHDAVAWSNRDGTLAKAEANDLAALVDSGQWGGATEAEAVELPTRGTLLRSTPTDTNTASDWVLSTGGESAPSTTGSVTTANAPASSAGSSNTKSAQVPKTPSVPKKPAATGGSATVKKTTKAATPVKDTHLPSSGPADLVLLTVIGATALPRCWRLGRGLVLGHLYRLYGGR